MFLGLTKSLGLTDFGSEEIQAPKDIKVPTKNFDKKGILVQKIVLQNFVSLVCTQNFRPRVPFLG